MANDAGKKETRKQKVVSELKEYLVLFVYLAVFFGVFTWYRKLVLTEYSIDYTALGVSVIQALVLAKVILIGDAMHLGGGHEEKPLIVPTLYKSVIFSLFVAVFAVIEHTIGSLAHGKGWLGGLHEVLHEGRSELLARCMVMFVAFIPLFAFKELGRVLGPEKVLLPFFRRGEGQGTAP